MNELKTAIINNQILKLKTYKGKRVVTCRDVDLVHERPDGTAGRNFRENRRRFIEGEDFFQRNSSEAKEEYGIVAPNGLILLTETGYLMLVKSFTDDLAWDVQRQLVKNYFELQTQTTITYQYPLPAATFESVANLGRLIERVMRTEGACPHEIAIVLRTIFNQAGLDISECFVKIPAYEQLSMTNNNGTLIVN